MTKYHAELMKGTTGEAARELTDAALAEFDRWAQYAPSQAASVVKDDPEGAARFALNDVREELVDYLPHALALVLTSWGIGLVDGGD